MNRDEKLRIIGDLIENAEKITYSNESDMSRCEDDVKSFIRNIISKDSVWLGRIDKIRWGPGIFTSETPDSVFISSWNSGKADFIGVLRSIENEIKLYSDEVKVDSIQSLKPKSNKVFIVHGHNDTIKLAAARVITQLGLLPIILHEQPNKGRTIIEKFERLSSDVGFAIVLLTADDLMGDGKYCARQNVIFELGYFISKLGRERVIALYDVSGSEIEIPSDITGVLYEPYDKPDGSWRFEVVQELKEAGFDIDANSLIDQTSAID